MCIKCGCGKKKGEAGYGEGKPKDKSGKTRISPMNTHLRDMQKEAAKRAREDKIWNTLQKQSANNDGRNTI